MMNLRTLVASTVTFRYVHPAEGMAGFGNATATLRLTTGRRPRAFLRNPDGGHQFWDLPGARWLEIPAPEAFSILLACPWHHGDTRHRLTADLGQMGVRS